MTGSAPRVLVTGARLPAALEIARALASCGAQVWAGDSVLCTPTRASAAVRGQVHLPSPALRFADFRQTLLREVRQRRITHIVPVSEEVFYLARLRAELEPDIRLFAPGLQQLRELHSKWMVLSLAADCGADIPPTWRAEERADLHELLALHPAAVAKPEYSRGAYFARLPPHASWDPPPESYPWLVQQRIPGREISTIALTWQGRVLAQACYLPKYRSGGGMGAALYFDPVECAAARDFMVRFASKHGLTGHLAFDFIEDGGRLTLLECNPRATSGVHLLDESRRWGCAYWGEAASDLRPATQPRGSKLGVWLEHGFDAWRQDAAQALRADLRRAHDSCHEPNDPWPAWLLPLGAIEIALRSLAWPVATRHAYTFDLEWNGIA